MKFINILSLAALLAFASCGKENNQSSDSGSDSQTTPNDSSGAESRAASGVAEDNQKKVAGYPSNQSNLNSDSTSRLHDVDTTSAKMKKDQPNKHQ
ncbi:hypothetical protein [Dyadobacter psychrotolerans]|uniref:Lipoprotein n=1 Tax=Dyadobacter psychrotolerans TaxID=2541721 RepID=A0A4R5DM10_9BACT|nr:hypothetical protein [Dyadobacter psychrotolerans]TDE14497.1 hypothetical protein E0F88_14960 [Dyadobacter psychrotolerans]